MKPSSLPSPLSFSQFISLIFSLSFSFHSFLYSSLYLPYQWHPSNPPIHGRAAVPNLPVAEPANVPPPEPRIASPVPRVTDESDSGPIRAIHAVLVGPPVVLVLIIAAGRATIQTTRTMRGIGTGAG